MPPKTVFDSKHWTKSKLFSRKIPPLAQRRVDSHSQPTKDSQNPIFGRATKSRAVGRTIFDDFSNIPLSVRDPRSPCHP